MCMHANIYTDVMCIQYILSKFDLRRSLPTTSEVSGLEK